MRRRYGRLEVLQGPIMFVVRLGPVPLVCASGHNEHDRNVSLRVFFGPAASRRWGEFWDEDLGTPRGGTLGMSSSCWLIFL